MPVAQNSKSWFCCLLSFRRQSHPTSIDERTISKLDITDPDQCKHLRSLVESMPDASLIDSVSRLSPSSCVKLCNACPTIARSLTPSKLVSSIRALQHQPSASLSNSIDTTKKCNVFTIAICTLYRTMGDKDYAWLLDTLLQAEQLEQVADLLKVMRHLECPSNRTQMDTFVRTMHKHRSIFVQKEMLVVLSTKLGKDDRPTTIAASIFSVESMKLLMDMLRNKLLIGQTLSLFTCLLKQKLANQNMLVGEIAEVNDDKEELKKMMQRNKDKLIQLLTNKEEFKTMLAGRAEQQAIKILLDLLK